MEEIAKVIDKLKKSRSLLFITGAGISAESGLPTYRGIGGLYESEDTEDGIPIEMALAGEMIEANPAVTWKYLSQIERNCRGTGFNRAHEIIAQMQDRFERVWVLTQNVDGFHTAAGMKNCIEIHGNMHHLKCTRCPWRTVVDDFRGMAVPPECPKCGRAARPDVVLFGEMLPYDKVQLLEDQLHRGFDIYFWIGTTGVFSYIQGPLFDARQRGHMSVEINPCETVLSDEVDVKIAMGATEALTKIWEGLE